MGFVADAFGAKNTTNVKSATGANNFTPQDFAPAIGRASSGLQNQLETLNNVSGQQGSLADQLLAQSQGQGPNIAELQLKQATDRNNQQAAGLLASQRGLNPALAARLIAQNQAASNQQAAGQSGVMRAQQQLAAQGALANVYGQQANEAIGGAGAENQNLGINENALGNQNSQIIGAQNNANQINAQAESQNSGFAQKLVGGALNSGLGAVGLAEGGEARKDFTKGGNVPGEPAIKHNDPSNDVVPAWLTKKEVVLPLDVTLAKDAPERAKKFMEKIMEEKEPGPKGYSKVLEAKRRLKEAAEHIKSAHEALHGKA